MAVFQGKRRESWAEYLANLPSLFVRSIFRHNYPNNDVDRSEIVFKNRRLVWSTGFPLSSMRGITSEKTFPIISSCVHPNNCSATLLEKIIFCSLLHRP